MENILQKNNITQTKDDDSEPSVSMVKVVYSGTKRKNPRYIVLTDQGLEVREIAEPIGIPHDVVGNAFVFI